MALRENIYSLDDLRDYAKKIYPDATDADETSPNNSLHQFVGYHLLDVQRARTKLVLNRGYVSSYDWHTWHDYICDEDYRVDQYYVSMQPNMLLNIQNANINKCENNFYLLGDVGKCLSKINDKVDSVIVDPPRAGLDKITKDTLIKFKPNKIIYVSCDPLTLARDLKELKEHYDIKVIKGLDMFPYTYHCESITVLERR